MLREQGPEFARIVNAVSAKLTNRVLRQMNGAVDLEGRRPADVARAFLRDNDLL